MSIEIASSSSSSLSGSSGSAWGSATKGSVETMGYEQSIFTVKGPNTSIDTKVIESRS